MNNKNKTFLQNVKDTHKLFNDHIRRKADALGYNYTYHTIMIYLAHFSKATQVDLVKFTHLKAPTISLTLQKMETEGLIKREVDENDMRNIIVSFTDKGKQAEQNLHELVAKKDEEAMRGISVDDIDIANKVLEQIRANIGGNDEDF